MIYNALLNCVMELTAIVGSVNHPFHLHGYSFAVLETGNTTDPEHLEQLLQEYNSKQLNKTHKPPFVDTLAVPSQGYAVVRFKADNPGKCNVTA